VPLCKRPCLSTPGALGSRTSSVVSRAHRVLRPHPPVPQARDDFTAWPLIHRAFAVRVRLGDPRDLPYFRDRTLQACRRPYAGGFEVLSRCVCAPQCQTSSLCPRVATHEIPPLPATRGGDLLFRRGIVRVMLRPVCLPSPPDWLRPAWSHVCSTEPSENCVTPAFDAVRCRAALGVRLDGRTGNLPSSGLTPDQLRQLVRLHDKVVLAERAETTERIAAIAAIPALSNLSFSTMDRRTAPRSSEHSRPPLNTGPATATLIKCAAPTA
jgi:hypothetical protein